MKPPKTFVSALSRELRRQKLRGFIPLEDALEFELRPETREWILERIAAGDPGPMHFHGEECWTDQENQEGEQD